MKWPLKKPLQQLQRNKSIGSAKGRDLIFHNL
jgi:hypothetical protein